MGHPFQSPFASPPGEGLSSALVNVLWGAANLVVAYLLLAQVRTFEFRSWRHVLVAASGGLIVAIQLARHFGRFYDGL
jgi:adenine/guanine phosphoribosyltransferase-like PRPP-binding protein